MKMRQAVFTLCLLFLMGISFGGQAHADSISKESVNETVKEAAGKQRSLMEGVYTAEEIKGIMQPYFTDAFIRQFMDETMFEENGNYQVLGTDFAPHVIPPFGDDIDLEECNVNREERMCLYGYFPAFNDGPVGYEAHYEAVILAIEDGEWKITGIDYEYIPEHSKSRPAAEPLEAAKLSSTPATAEFDPRNSSFFEPLITLFSIFSFIGR